VTLNLCVSLWAIPGQEDAFIDYENRVLQRLADYEARIVARVRSVEGVLCEVQILEFPSEDALSAFMRDPERQTLSALRDQAIERTEILRVSIVSLPGTSS
jgi:uncharacterized protein (DUF1330 family)